MPRLKKKYEQPEAVPAVPISKDYLNLKQAAVYLSVSIWTIRGLIRSGALPAKQLGKYQIVRKNNLDNAWEKAAA